LSSRAARGTPAFSGVAHVTINVRDLDRSIAWYRDVMGFDEPWLVISDQVAVLFHPESKAEVVLRQGRVPSRDTGEPVFHVAFRVEDNEQLRVWERHLNGLGVDARITKAVGGVNIDLEDPDGNDLELFAYDPPRESS
jgi:catechol 2,3-dioxygenase-like lactoylglutathione lyase family enzyme